MEKWFMRNRAGDAAQIGRTYGISPTLARLALNRGVKSGEELRKYLHPSLQDMHPAELLKDVERTCAILEEKIREGKKIRVVGDYDVDGVMSTYIFCTALRECGARADYVIPDRIRDGYGINIQIVERAAADGVDTLLTCDNGISAREQIAFGKERGMTVLVTDHHDIPIGEPLPCADAIVNPKQEDCPYPFPDICGAVVAMKVSELLYHRMGLGRERAGKFLELAAFATVCDVMDLVGENRVIAHFGLERMRETRNVGLQELIGANGLRQGSLSAYHLGFVLGPCVNASGRLETANLALSLLLCEDRGEARRLAGELKRLNDERKAMTEESLGKAIRQVEEEGLLEDRVLVAYLEDCHESLAGIIAGRLRERYHRPAFVLTRGKDGVKGSGRSIPEYSMYEEISKCKELLTMFGGHPMAAGFSLPEGNWRAFRKMLNEKSSLTEDDLTPKVSFDMELPIEEADLALVREMDLLEPYGKGNPKPLFAERGARFLSATPVGKEGDMLRLAVLGSQDGRRHTVMLFRNADEFAARLEEKYGAGAMGRLLSGEGEGFRMDVLYSLSLHEYNGLETAQAVLEHFR